MNKAENNMQSIMRGRKKKHVLVSTTLIILQEYYYSLQRAEILPQKGTSTLMKGSQSISVSPSIHGPLRVKLSLKLGEVLVGSYSETKVTEVCYKEGGKNKGHLKCNLKLLGLGSHRCSP